jgi:hypothetical protein
MIFMPVQQDAICSRLPFMKIEGLVWRLSLDNPPHLLIDANSEVRLVVPFRMPAHPAY